MRDNLRKSETMDQNEKGTEIQRWDWSLSGIKLNKIESLKLLKGCDWMKS